MNRNMLSATLCAVAVLCSISAARATVLVYEGFHAADYGNKTGSNSTTASNGNTTGDYTVGVALGGWSANGTSTVRVTGPANGLALPTVMTDAGFTAVGCAIGMSTDNNKSDMKCMYHNLTEGALNVSSGTLYFRMLLAVDSKAAAKLVAGESLAEKSGGYYGFGFGVAPTSNNDYAPTRMNSALSFAIWKNSANQYVLSLVHTTSDGTTFTAYPIVDSITLGSTYVCYAEVKVGAGTDGKELVRAGAMAAGDYATSIPWVTFSGSSDTVEVELISNSSYPTCMAVAGAYGTNNGRFRADEIAVGTKLGDVLLADGAFTVAPSGSPTIGQTTFSSDWKLIAGTDVTADAEIVYSTDSSFATATTNALGTGLSAGTRTALLTGLEPDTTYWWKVSADKSGELNESFAKSFRTAGVPILGDVSATAVENAITFSVALAEAALGNTLDTTVSVFYGTDGETWTELQQGTTSSAQTYADTVSDLTYGTTYLWYVRASATSGNRTFEAVSATNSVTVLHTGDLYVDVSTSNAVAPYSTPETAAPNIKTALDIAADGSTIHVAPGTYTLAMEKDNPITVTNAIRIVGDGETPEDVIIQRTSRASANSSAYRSYQDLSLFHLNHPDALVANLVLNYGSAHQPSTDKTAGSAWIGANGGTISNCVVRGGRASHPYAVTPGILVLGPGLVTHCVITNNSGTSAMESSWAGTMLGNAVVLKGAGSRLENCLIRDNRSGVEGGTGSDKTSTVCAQSTATIANCTIIGNRARNCGGVFANATGVTVRNCVIAGNVDVGATADNPNWKGSGTFLSCATDDATAINENCFTGTAESFFNDYANGDYTPKAGGPLVNAGANYEGMASVDLSGNRRNVGKLIDIGCYECQKENGIFIIVR